MEEQQQFLKGNINQQNGIVTAAGARLMQNFQLAKQQQDMQAASMFSKPIWMTGQDNKQFQAGIYGPGGQPHFLPSTGFQQQSQSFMPAPEVVQSMKEAGYTFAPTSGKAGRWINTDGSKPDLDEQGNPKFSPDGTAYISGGKIKPLTQPMADARKEWLQKQEDAKKAAGPHWYDQFVPDSLKSQPAPSATPAATPAQTNAPVKVQTPAEAQGLAPGTRYVAPDGITRVR